MAIPDRDEAHPRGTTAPSAERLDVSVLVVTWNSERWVARCLEALPAACQGLAWEAIVYDNASRDRTAELADGFRASEPVTVVRDERNSGFAGGVNRALARARGRFVLLLNPDCEMSPGSVCQLVERLDAQPVVGAAAPVLLGEDGSPQREFQLRRFPTLRSFAAELLLTDRLLGRNDDVGRYRYRDLDISKEQPIEQPAGAALIVRRDVIDQVGLLDEQFAPAWFEDVDYCQRIWQRGHAIHLVPEAKAIHHGGASLEHMEHGEFIAIWYANLNRYARKWLTPREVELLRWFVILGMILRASAVSLGVRRFSEGRFEAVKGYLRVLRAAWSRWDESSQSY